MIGVPLGARNTAVPVLSQKKGSRYTVSRDFQAFCNSLRSLSTACSFSSHFSWLAAGPERRGLPDVAATVPCTSFWIERAIRNHRQSYAHCGYARLGGY